MEAPSKLRHVSAVLFVLAVAVSMAFSFDPSQIHQVHGTILLIVCLAAVHFAGTRAEVLLAMLACLDGPFEACAILLMPTEASAQWLDLLCYVQPPHMMLAGPAVAATVGNAISTSKLSRCEMLSMIVPVIFGFVVVLPSAAAYVHGEALGLQYVRITFFYVMVPGFASCLLTTVWLKVRKLKRARAAALAARAASAVHAGSAQATVPAVPAVPWPPPVPVVVAPVVAPVAPVPWLPESSPGHDLNDSEGDMSASASYSSSGDEQYLAQWGPLAFGEVEADGEEQDAV